MLNTLLKIGQWQSEGKSEWDRFLEKPKVEYEDKNGNEIKNYILPIVFDLDAQSIVIKSENLIAYDEKYVEKLLCLKILGRRYKAFYSTSTTEKFIQVFKTFFGKPIVLDSDNSVTEGDLFSIVNRDFPECKDFTFFKVLKDIFAMKPSVETCIIDEKGKINVGGIYSELGLERRSPIVLISLMIKSEKYNIHEPTYFSDLKGYRDFIKKKYEINIDKSISESEDSDSLSKLCYVNNKPVKDANELNLTASYSLNKMFVTTTQNYLTGFEKKRASDNYQISLKSQEHLDVASSFILKNYKVKIANIDHVIIPQFLSHSDLELELALSGIKTQTDLLFNLKSLESYILDIQDETDHLFWINFIAFESDGNFFKSTEVIKDVSSFYFQKVLRTFLDVDWDFKKADFTDWNSVMTSYGKAGMFFNFNTIYQLIPLRKEKEKKNKALSLMKTILENRKVDRHNIFSYFCELLLCHFYERYQSYTNIGKSSKDYFSLSIRNSTFKYLAFFEVLKKLNLIDMNEETHVSPAETGNKYDEAIQGFFTKMQLNPHQQAMFYLGRMLNSVEFIQKGKKKTVIEKVNFNGMDRDDIQRLRLSLIEKAKQYSKVGKVVFTDSKFGELFDYNQWSMNPQEAVFFLMTGYSFGISSKEVTELEEAESEEQEN